MLNNEIDIYMIEIYNRRKIILYLCILDILFTLLYTIQSIWFLLLCLLPILGYYGIKNLNKYYLMYYLLFCFINIGLKGYFLYKSILLSEYIVGFITLCVQIWIFYYVCIFWKYIGQIAESDIFNLQNGWRPLGVDV